MLPDRACRPSWLAQSWPADVDRRPSYRGAHLVTIYDPEYHATKLLVQGKAALEPLFAEMADWIAGMWHVKVLNVIHDEVDAPERRPRLQVILEHTHERQKFFDGLNFDPVKQQAIAARFAKLVTSQRRSAPHDTDRLLVVFSAFAPLAREEADSRIPDDEVNALQRRIADPDLWTIHRCFGRVTFMFYTDEQARKCVEDGRRDTYADRYFELLQKHDEFGYLRRSRFSIECDSKANFDSNYASSWFYYDR
jgi:hypothetical protein